LPDLIVPEMSGNKNAQSLRNRSETKKIPRIFLTALITKDEGGELNVWQT